MVRGLFIFISMIVMSITAFSENQHPIIGWHWYNEPHDDKKQRHKTDPLIRLFQQLTPLQQLKLLQMATDNLRARAVLSGRVSDITAYKKAQDFWVSRATRFTVGWEYMLLAHPELNYSLSYSHENALAPIMQRDKHVRENQAVLALARTNGLLFFYRGKNKGDQFFSEIVSHYAKRYHLSLIPISVDGGLSPVLKNSRQKKGMKKAKALGVYYFPALVLVNPATHRYKMVSYGVKSEEELSDRLLKIADGWKAEF